MICILRLFGNKIYFIMKMNVLHMAGVYFAGATPYNKNYAKSYR